MCTPPGWRSATHRSLTRWPVVTGWGIYNDNRNSKTVPAYEFLWIRSTCDYHHHHHHHHTNIIRVSYNEQLPEHWTRSNSATRTQQCGSQDRDLAKRYVFKWRLKADIVEESVTKDGNAFQTRAPATGKERSPIVVLRVGGTTREGEDVDRSRRLVPLSATRCSSSDRYAEAAPCRQRKTSAESLNCIRSDTCGQWRSRSSGVTCSYFRAKKTRRAAAFNLTYILPWMLTTARCLVED